MVGVGFCGCLASANRIGIVDTVDGQVVPQHGIELIIFVHLTKLGVKFIPFVKE